MIEHWFWLLLAIACVVWYMSVTVYVAIRGIKDIRIMLARIAAGAQRGAQPPENAAQ